LNKNNIGKEEKDKKISFPSSTWEGE